MTAATILKPVLPTFAPVAVVDIGSNSVRLVVYDALRRVPSPVFNEKILCGLGRGVAATGHLSSDGVKRALAALSRFGALCDQIGVVDCFAIATAAAREARNGPQFIKAGQKALGSNIRVLTGKEEARFAALGVISSIPEADGIVGDMGGGSLELVDVKNGAINAGVTLPLGPFRLMDAISAGEGTASEIIATALEKSGMMESMRERRFFAVGGAWRNLAKIRMRQEKYPLSVLQQYTLKTSTARSAAIYVAGLDAGELRDVEGASKKRSETLPLAAQVLDTVLTRGDPKEVVFSVFGVREGLLFDNLKKDKRKRDPLLSGCWDFARRYARSPQHENELCDWSDEFFAAELFKENRSDTRLRHAACLLADIGWRASPDFRGARSLNLIAQANIVGLDHPARVFLALTIYFRYMGPFNPAPAKLSALISKKVEARARQLAATLRLAYSLTAAMPGVLPKLPLVLKNNETVQLQVPEKYRALAGEVVEKRLEQLASLLESTAKLQEI